MRKIYCLVTGIGVFLLQAMILPRLFNGVVQPNVIQLAVILISLRYGQRMGLGIAIIGGFVQDVVIGNFFGVHLLPYLAIAFICSYVGRLLEKGQYILLILIVLAATEASLVLTYAVLTLSGQFVSLPAYLAQYSGPLLICHGLLAYPADKIVRHMRRDDEYFGFMSYYR